MANVFESAMTGLRAAQMGLATTSHNIANANTEGYSRQRVEQATNLPELQGNSYVGTGTVVSDISRITSEFVDGRLKTQLSENSRLQTFYDLASRVDTMMGSDALNVSPMMQEFFNALEELNNDPASQAARQVVLDTSSNLVSRLQTQASELGSLNTEVNQRVRSDVGDINSIASSIAKLNEEIVAATGDAQGGSPNDLLDQRDQLLSDLSEYISIQTLKQDGGQIDVYVGNGINLVLGKDAQTLTTTNSPYDSSRLEIAVPTSTGVVNVNSLISGGSLGGLMDFRREVLDNTGNDLGLVTTVFVDAINAQHAKGVDLYGEPGMDLFTIAGPQVSPLSANNGTATIEVSLDNAGALTASNYRLDYNGTDYTITRLSDNRSQTGGLPANIDGLTIELTGGAAVAGDSFLIQPTSTAAGTISLAINDTNRLAWGLAVEGAQSLSNTGGGKMTQPKVLDETNPALSNEISIVFNDATTFNVIDIATGTVLGNNVAYSGGTDIDYNGWRVQVTGIPDPGDTFTISAAVNGVSDNRNGLLMANLQEDLLVDGRNTLQEGLSSMVGSVGSLTRQAKVAGSAQEALLEQTIMERDSISAVNLDEEAINLTRYQQAYQASAQVMSTANTLFDSILSIFR